MMELLSQRLEAASPRLVMLKVDGDIDTTTAPQLQQEFCKELSAGYTMMIVDMAGVRYVSSMGLRVFLSQLKKLKAAGGRLILSGCNDLVEEVFRISGFASFFEMTADIAEAQEILCKPATPNGKQRESG
jgi:anti-sigma B factor antagonist